MSTETFTYDAAGNITDAPDSCFQYDTNNRLVVFNGNSVSYDLDGNMLNNGVKGFTYDSANRLITVGGHTYTYNAEDVRIRNLCAEEDTTYTYDTNCRLSKLLCKTTNGVTTKFVYGLGLIGEEVSSAFKTYHFDCRGSAVAITDASGNITDTFVYDTYGKLLSRTGTSKVIFGYNGRDGVVTDDNGLIYMRTRYYSPEMKRFLNADVIPGAISNAITLNRFAYANGNPVSFVDPFGLSVWSWLKENVIDPVGDAASTVGNAIADGAQVAGEFITDTATTVGNALVDGATAVGEFIVDTAVSTGNAIVDGAVAAGEFIADTAVSTGNAIVNGAVAAGEFIVDTAVSTGNAIVEGADAVGGFIKDTASTLGNAIAYGKKQIYNAQQSINRFLNSRETKVALDIGVNMISFLAGSRVGFGTVNNIVNAAYYNWFSDGESDLTPTSYQNGYINRWDRLDYAKQQSGEDSYNLNAWRYASEYNFHMYGWFLTGWAKDQNVPLISKLAERFEIADVEANNWDHRWYVNVATVLTGILGL